jgi:hypothetical protein
MPNTYPIILLPEGLLKIVSANPTIPSPPVEPPKPILKEPILPLKPAEPTSFSQAWGCGLLLMGMFGLIVYSARSSKFVGDIMSNLPTLFMLIFLLAPFIGIYLIYSYHINASKKKEEYVKKFKQYETDLKKYNESKTTYKVNHDKSLIEYKTITFPNYLRQLLDHESEKIRILSPVNILNHRISLIKDFLQESRKPKRVDNPYLTGVSEAAFFNFLKSKSLNYERNYSVLDDKFAGRYYVPDIVYFDRNNGLLIDIEIDEPYLGSDGSPIHYLGFDDKRNEYFKNCGWIIVRFAEEQVVKYAEQCYSLINKLIQGVNMANFNFNVKELPPVPQWTKDEAHKLAFVRSRNKYLGRNLIEKIPNEILIEKPNEIEKRAIWEDDLPF